MLDLLNTNMALRARTVLFTLKDYLVVAQIAMGEDKRVAYASVYDTDELEKRLGTEEEEEYLEQFERNVNTLLEKRGAKYLKEYLEVAFDSEVQARASTLQNYRFSGSDIQQILANLLHNRVVGGLDDASVKEILMLVKSMYESGALEGNDNFDKHFITIPNKYNTVCPSCNREGYATEGLDFRCEHCGHIAKWSESERRYYPQLSHL